jgi:acyl CoA:acetate/3-ketoacid CoA transferase alpha subunit
VTVAVVCAHAADALGNLVYDKTARNFNADMATVIAVATPHLFVGSLVPECTLSR